MPPVLQILRSAAASLSEAIYPSRCEVCSTSLSDVGWLCDKCNEQLNKLAEHPACPRCAAPLSMDGAPCPFCKGKGLYPLRLIARLAIYEEPLRQLIHRMKYESRWPLAELLAERLCEQRSLAGLMSHIDLVVPVPLHIRRRLSRGYNQSDVIAGVISRRFHKPIARVISRLRSTPTQTRIFAQADRQANVKHAFGLLDEKRVAGKHIMLVDDVMTTGATLRETARCMLFAKPASISAAVLAVADPKHRHFTRV
ncbi:MAG: ComF family protein [Tepidisphaeraceae bacterium]|jgi:ComF family protein